MNCFGLGDALGEALGNRNALLVASTDLSHFYSSEEAERLDNVMIADVKSCDHKMLMHDLETHRTEACGGGQL